MSQRIIGIPHKLLQITKGLSPKLRRIKIDMQVEEAEMVKASDFQRYIKEIEPEERIWFLKGYVARELETKQLIEKVEELRAKLEKKLKELNEPNLCQGGQ